MCTNEFLPMQKWKWTRHNAFVVAGRQYKSRWTVFFLSCSLGECQRKVLRNVSRISCVQLEMSERDIFYYFFNRLATKYCAKLSRNRNFRLITDDRTTMSSRRLARSLIRNFMQCMTLFASLLFSTIRIQPATDQHQLTVSSRSTAFLHRFGFSFLSLCCGVVSVRSWNCFAQFFLKQNWWLRFIEKIAR